MDDSTGKLLSEQISRLADSIKNQLSSQDQALQHHKEIEAERINLLQAQIDLLKQDHQDQEQRIRKMDDIVISLKTSDSIKQAGQAALTLIAAAIAAWLGGRI
jgi:CRISPR/Cas system-associated exonuclease Cas4 (RecB family)